MESSGDVSKDELEIRAALEKFIVAYENNDEPSMRSLFAPDFVDMSAGEPTRQGEAAIGLMLMRASRAHASAAPRLQVNIHKIEVSGNLAYQRGELIVTITPRGGGEASYIRQRFLEVWRHGRDGWRSIVGMDNE